VSAPFAESVGASMRQVIEITAFGPSVDAPPSPMERPFTRLATSSERTIPRGIP